MLLDGAMARLGAGLVRWGGKALAAAVSHEPRTSLREDVCRVVSEVFQNPANTSPFSRCWQQKPVRPSTVFAVFSESPNFLKIEHAETSFRRAPWFLSSPLVAAGTPRRRRCRPP
jgi:hypothetical protein